MAGYRVNWNSRQMTSQLSKQLESRINVFSRNILAETKRNVSRPNPTKKNPSKVGEYPKKVSGDFQKSLKRDVFKEGDSVGASFYSDDIKARRLELGFFGRDSLGRLYAQGPRPTFARMLANLRSRFFKALMRGGLR